VFIALPHNALGMVEWGGEPLRKAMTRFIAYYDHPGHYLRVSALFQRPFWRTLLRGSWFMLDAFGGCCVYDEGMRYGAGDYGVLSWLLAGNSAASMSNFRDGTLVDLVLDSLPRGLAREGRQTLLEAKVHRWIASVSAQPGGVPIRDYRSAHLPEAEQHPGIFMVGDYLFDSTLNGVLDSAQFATDLWHSWKLKHQILQRSAGANGFVQKRQACVDASGNQNRNGNRRGSLAKTHHNGKDPHSILSNWSISREYFDDYHEGHSYAEAFHEYFDAEYVRDLIGIAWNVKPPYRLLDAGSASGLTLHEFAKCGIDAWGVERNRYIHNLTPRQLKKRNLLGDVRKLSFADNSFDFVYETCLGYLPEGEVANASKELQRVAKRGVIFGSITSDMNPKLFDRSNLVWGVKTLMTLWEWSEVFVANGFQLAVTDRKTMTSLWRCEKKYNAGDDDWYRDKQSLSYCFYSKRGDPNT